MIYIIEIEMSSGWGKRDRKNGAIPKSHRSCNTIVRLLVDQSENTKVVDHGYSTSVSLRVVSSSRLVSSASVRFF